MIVPLPLCFKHTKKYLLSFLISILQMSQFMLTKSPEVFKFAVVALELQHAHYSLVAELGRVACWAHFWNCADHSDLSFILEWQSSHPHCLEFFVHAFTSCYTRIDERSHVQKLLHNPLFCPCALLCAALFPNCESLFCMCGNNNSSCFTGLRGQSMFHILCTCRCPKCAVNLVRFLLRRSSGISCSLAWRSSLFAVARLFDSRIRSVFLHYFLFFVFGSGPSAFPPLSGL